MSLATSCLLISRLAVAAAANVSPMAPPETPYNLVVVVVDTSGSMKDGRLDTAVQEINQFAAQLPPTANHPWVVIPFHDRAYGTRRFQNGPEEIAAYLGQLSADGGTHIASGLAAAIEAVQVTRDVPHVVVMLYTDGEDKDQAGLDAQQIRLSQMFAQRNEKGLGQTVICRRWATANAKLVSRLRQQAGVRMIDAGETQLSAVVISPQVELVAATWSQTDLGYLELRLRARATTTAPLHLSTLKFRCRHQQIEGETEVEVPINDPRGGEFQCRCRVPLQPLPRQITVGFDVEPPAIQLSGNTLVFPSLARHRVTVAHPIPRLILHDVISAELTARSPGQWTDPHGRIASIPLVLTIKRRDNPLTAALDQVRFRLRGGGPTGLPTSGQLVTMLAAQETTVELPTALAFELQNGKVAPQTVRRELAVDQVIPEGIAIQPCKLLVELAVPPPPPVVTTVRAELVAAEPAAWVRLVDSQATFRARVRITADGPLPPDALLDLLPPAGVYHVELHPPAIRQGEQLVTLNVTAVLQAGQTNSLRFELASVASAAPIEVRSAGPLTLTVVGPAPATLALARGRSMPRRFELESADLATTPPLRLVPVVAGLPAEAAAGMLVRVGTRGPIGVAASEVPVLKPVLLPLAAHGTGTRSYFRDQYAETQLVCTPTVPTSAIRCCEQSIIIRQAAPFRRVLFQGSCAALALLAVAIPGHFLWRMNQSRSSL